MHLLRPQQVAALAATIAFSVAAAALAQRPVDFGQQWVRWHPLTLMGLQQWPQSFDAAEHRAAN
jgi:hypothetical protein